MFHAEGFKRHVDHVDCILFGTMLCSLCRHSLFLLLCMSGPVALKRLMNTWLGYIGLALNLLAPGKCGCNFESVFFTFISWSDILAISCGPSLGWRPQKSIDDNSALVQVKAWCGQAITRSNAGQIYVAIWRH